MRPQKGRIFLFIKSAAIITYNTTSVTLSDKNKTIPIRQLYRI